MHGCADTEDSTVWPNSPFRQFPVSGEHSLTKVAAIAIHLLVNLTLFRHTFASMKTLQAWSCWNKIDLKDEYFPLFFCIPDNIRL